MTKTKTRTYIQKASWNAPTPEAVRDLLAKHRLRQADLAELAGVTARTVQRWVAPTASLMHHYPMQSSWKLALLRLKIKGATAPKGKAA